MFPASSNGGVLIAFPDVCKTPARDAPPNPIPYPNIATKARHLQRARKTGAPAAGPTLPGGGAIRSAITGATAGALGQDAKTQTEANQLRGRLQSLNQTIAGLSSADPDEWQRLLQEYAVTAAALYVTLSG